MQPFMLVFREPEQPASSSMPQDGYTTRETKEDGEEEKDTD